MAHVHYALFCPLPACWAQLLSAGVRDTISRAVVRLEPGQSVSGVIAASPAEDSPLVYHSYRLELSEGQTSVRVILDGLGKDVDVAIHPGKAITDLADFTDAQIYDTSAATRSSHTLRNLRAQTVYISVLNLLESMAPYTLSSE